MRIVAVLVLANLSAIHAARLETHASGAKRAQVLKRMGSMTMNSAGPAKEQRLRAFDRRGWRSLKDGMDLPLTVPSFLEDTSYPIPSNWSAKLQKVEIIGAGGYGAVWKCRVLCERGPPTYMSLKLLEDKSDRNADDEERIQKEIHALGRMSGVSDYCISATGGPSSLRTKEGTWMLMPYMNGNDMRKALNRCVLEMDCSDCEGPWRCWSKVKVGGRRYSMAFMLAMFLDAVKGVDALHGQGMIHTDLKPENIMFNCEDNHCFAAVIDLGLVCSLRQEDDECWISGTPGYMAPEVYMEIEEAMHLPARDVWALGTILYQILYKRPPPYDSDTTGKKVNAYIPLRDKQIPQGENQTRLDKLVVQMLSKYTERPSIQYIIKELEDIIAHQFSDAEAQEMVTKSPTERGANIVTPKCLFESWGKDIGDLPFQREYCADTPEPTNMPFRCGICRGCNPCCKCRVIRNNKLVKEYFRMQVCE